MKNKIIKFCKEKRELLVFITIMVVLVSTVVVIANLASDNNDQLVSVNQDIQKPDDENNDNKDVEENKEPNVQEKEEVMEKPLNVEHKIVRHFYDASNSQTIEDSIITNGRSFQTSKGVGFAGINEEEFECLNMLSGTVESAVSTDLNGYVVTINNNDGLKTIFYNLSSISVEVGNVLEAGDVIGKSGTSLIDTEAKNHVFVEMKLNNNYLNPLSYIGKTKEMIINQEK